MKISSVKKYLSLILLTIIQEVCFAAHTDSTGITFSSFTSLNSPQGNLPCYYYFSDSYNITPPGISDTGSGTQVSFLDGSAQTPTLCPGTYQIIASFWLYQKSISSVTLQLGIQTSSGSSPTYTSETLNVGAYNSWWYFITYNNISIPSGGSILASPYIKDTPPGSNFYLIGGQYTVFFLHS